jgi:uncharacterized protein YeaO (DUF488 family)
MQIFLKRTYEDPGDDDGFRVLVDRVWPRGIKKGDLRLDDWLKEIAPSTELRKWFGHDPAKWDEFKHRYFLELAEHKELLADLVSKAKVGRLTLVYSAKDERHNNAVALKAYLESRTKG